VKVRPGDVVRVPWGLNEVEGTVIDVYGLPSALFATVRVMLPGADDESVVEVEELTFRADALELTHAVA